MISLRWTKKFPVVVDSQSAVLVNRFLVVDENQFVVAVLGHHTQYQQ